jgi:uncharacterized protein YfaP (DUF2135 family)
MNNKSQCRIFPLVVLLTALIAVQAHGVDGIRIEAPVGGYVDSSGETSRYTQDVRYPASFVSTPEDQSMKALIKGRVEGSPKGRQPYTLIVNGVAMPLRVDANTGFSRPYVFGKGSNSVEIRSPDRTQKKRVQFYDSYAGKTQAKVRIVLSWDTDGNDLDLHVLTPDGQHCFYGNRVLSNGGALDVDVTTGYGPEIFSLPIAIRGAYHIYVNYYGTGEAREVITVVQIAVILNENTPDEKQQVFRIPMRKPGELTLVKSFVYP